MYQISDLNFKYKNKGPVILKDLNFTIPEGRILGVIGPNGSGKTTLHKILLNLIKDYEGHVYVDEKISDKELKETTNKYYNHIGVGFDRSTFYPKLTIRENLFFFASLYENKANVDELLHKIGLWNDSNVLVGHASPGMIGKLSFVRALVNNPQVLILDEPTAHLDVKGVALVKKMIQEFKDNGGTVIITTQIMNDAQEICDDILFLRNGEMIEHDSLTNLKVKYGKNKLLVETNENNEINLYEFDISTLGSNKEYLELLKAGNILTMHSQETTLNEIYQILTKND